MGISKPFTIYLWPKRPTLLRNIDIKIRSPEKVGLFGYRYRSFQRYVEKNSLRVPEFAKSPNFEGGGRAAKKIAQSASRSRLVFFRFELQGLLASLSA